MSHSQRLGGMPALGWMATSLPGRRPARQVALRCRPGLAPACSPLRAEKEARMADAKQAEAKLTRAQVCEMGGGAGGGAGSHACAHVRRHACSRPASNGVVPAGCAKPRGAPPGRAPPPGPPGRSTLTLQSRSMLYPSRTRSERAPGRQAAWCRLVHQWSPTSDVHRGVRSRWTCHARTLPACPPAVSVQPPACHGTASDTPPLPDPLLPHHPAGRHSRWRTWRWRAGATW